MAPLVVPVAAPTRDPRTLRLVARPEASSRVTGRGARPLESVRRTLRLRGGRRAARLAIAGGLGGFVALDALVRANRSAALDLAITLKLQQRSSPALDRVLAAASWPGFPPQSRLIPPAIIALAAWSGRRREAGFLALAWGAALLSTVVKATVQRQRPLAPVVRVAVAPLGGSSFPSGHVLTYVGWYGFLAHLAAVHLDEPVVRRSVVASLLGLIALVGPSRVEQGHHWATDVLASYLLGLAYLTVVIELYGRAAGPSGAAVRHAVGVAERLVGT